MADVLLKGGRVVDPANDRDGVFDVLLKNGLVARVEPAISANGAEVVDAKGKIIAPGLVDLHTHLREPGREDKETLETGLRAAVRGGFTTVCAMPNTEPAMDSPGVVEFVQQAAARLGLATVKPIGAITVGRQGKDLTEFGELFNAGCVGLSDDGSPVADGFLMRRALEYAKVFGRPLIQHAEDPSLAAGGVMHEGLVATTLGLRGIPSEAEAVMVARDVALAELTGGRLHVAHVSCAQSVVLIRQAKRSGVQVTCEVTPHHLALTEDAVGSFDTQAKVNPPLRTEQDRQALLEGLRDGTIDAIATDHAPHTAWEKDAEFDAAPFGISGLETALGVCVETLVAPGLLTWPQLVDRMSRAPAAIIGAEAGTLGIGAPADVILVDPESRWTVTPAQFVSKGRHTPFAGRTLRGAVLRVWCRGTEVTGR